MLKHRRADSAVEQDITITARDSTETRTKIVCHLTNLSIRLGRPLKWDPEKEVIVGDEEANGWLAREQREPYTIRG